MDVDVEEGVALGWGIVVLAANGGRGQRNIWLTERCTALDGPSSPTGPRVVYGSLPRERRNLASMMALGALPGARSSIMGKATLPCDSGRGGTG